MAPTEELFNACPLAVTALGSIPPFLRDEPDIRAVLYADAKETERQEALIDALVLEMFPQSATEVGLPWWETLLKLAASPPGQTVEQRRAVVLAALTRMTADPRGSIWELQVAMIVGTNNFTYREHVAGDATSPAANVIQITLPYDPATFDYDRAQLLIQNITEAHIQVLVVSGGGFELGVSKLGLQTL